MSDTNAIAVIGLAGRFPGAADVEEFWANLLAGRHSISELTDEQILASGIDLADTRRPGYVRMAPLLDGFDQFDAGLFGFTEREAQVRDPQQRLFLETAHAALEHAGFDPAASPLRVGVYAGGAFNRYAELHVRRNASALRSFGELNIQTGNHNDYIATLVAYKLGLTGPALSVATACSTSLVAIHLASQAIKNGECDLAVAGGVEIELPYASGHRYVEGGINSPDGMTRSYDSAAAGTIFGNGVGAVVLKLLSDAVRDGDTVLAVLRGSAVSNDGSRKAGFTAPGVDGQIAVVAEALAVAELDAGSIGYVEGHGTATALGDPIEVQALTTAFRAYTDRSGYCVLGSVKSNVGHLGPAAGAAGFIKAVLSVRHGHIPATVHFRQPNPRMNLASTPFVVSGETLPWASAEPRRAGISSFGMGGTNAHIVIEQAPARAPAEPVDGPVLLTLSAASSAALSAMAERLAGHLSTTTDGLGEVAHTLAVGRRALPHRVSIVASEHDEAAAQLTAVADSPPELTVRAERPVAFVFPGQGSQFPGMAGALYRALPTFRAELDSCCAVVRDSLPVDLLALLVDGGDERVLTRTEVAQPALFAVEWALVRQLDAWGVRPSGMVGHSIGELVAATAAGVFDPTDAMRLVAARGRLMQAAPPGAMLAVALPPEELGPWLDRTELAAVNGERSSVLCGTEDAIAAVATELSRAGQRCTRLRTSHAFHSRLMDQAAAEFAEAVAAVDRHAPSLPWMSNVDGRPITAEAAVDPEYWARQLRGTVRFHSGVRALIGTDSVVLLEVGPGQALTAQLRRDAEVRARRLPVHSLTGQARDDQFATLLGVVGELWSAGVPVDRQAVDREGDGPRGTVVLPAYPYERRRYWVDPDPAPTAAPETVDDQLTVPGWRQLPPMSDPVDVTGPAWLVLHDDSTIPRALAAAGATVHEDTTDPRELDLTALRRLVSVAPNRPLEIVYCWTAGSRPAGADELETAQHWEEFGFLPALRLIQATARECAGRQVRITAVTTGCWDVSGTEELEPAKATVVGLLLTAAKESETLRTRILDASAGVDPPVLIAELAGDREQVALRPGRRWVPRYLPVTEPSDRLATLVRPGGVYVITGGLGALGLVAARELAAVAPVRLALLGRGGLTDRTLPAVRALEDAGSTVLALSADVTDRASLSAALDKIRTQLGEINGVIHSAGVAGGGLAAVKDPAVARAVLAPKVTGTLLLDELCGELDFMVLFSSIAAITTDLGLSDYAGANAFLDAFAHRRSRRGRTLSINWPAWSEVGMAVDNASAGSPVLRAMQRGAGDRLHPLLHRRVSGEMFESELDASLWPLAEHRIDGVPVLVGTAYLELALAALNAVDPGAGPAELTDVAFAAPLAIPDRRKVITSLTPAGDGWRFEIRTEDGPAPTVHASGRVARCAEPPPAPVDLAELSVAAAEPPKYNTGLVTVGPRWHNVIRAAAGDGVVLTDLELPAEFAADLDTYRLHPALLDGATAFSLDLDVQALPFAYRRVVVHGPLPGTLHSVLRVGDGDGRRMVVRDVSLVDSSGRVLVEVTGFTMRVVDRDLVRASVSAPAQASPPRINGLSTAAGGRLFRALLGTDLGPQVVVASDSLSGKLSRSKSITAGAVAEGLTRPVPVSEPSEDVTATEEILIRLWREVLGGEVGRDDDFFDLGGDSLVAVQLTSRIEVETAVQLPITALFDTPTVAQLAELLDERLASR